MDECDLCYGDTVQLMDEQRGIIRYIGEVSYGDPSKGRNKTGVFYGIELKSKTGQHNGSIRGRLYFKCAPRHGVFVRIKDIEYRMKQSKDKATRYHMNQLIWIKNKEQLGTIRYIGLCSHLDTHHNTGGLWFGIEISPQYTRGKYKTEGIIQNIVYFQSTKGCNALFVQSSNLSHVPKHILTKLEAEKAAEAPPLQLKKRKKGKGGKEERRSSVFDIIREKITDAFSKETKANANHIKSASVTVKSSLPSEEPSDDIFTHAIPTRTRARTRQSRSQSTPRSPFPGPPPQRDMVDPTRVPTLTKRQHRIPYDIATKKHKQSANKAAKANKQHKPQRSNHSLAAVHKRDKKRMQSNHTSKAKAKSPRRALQRSHSANPDAFKSKSKRPKKIDATQRPKRNSKQNKGRAHKQYTHRHNKHRHKGSASHHSHHSDSEEEGRIDRASRPTNIRRPRTPKAAKKTRPRRDKSPRRPKTPNVKKSKSRKRSRSPVNRDRKQASLRRAANSANHIHSPKVEKQRSHASYKSSNKSSETHASISPRGGKPKSWSRSPPEEIQSSLSPHSYHAQPYSFQKESSLPALIQMKSVDSPSSVSSASNQNSKQFDHHLGSPAPPQQPHAQKGSKRVKNGRSVNWNREEEARKATIMERAKLMMTALPFSHSSGVNQLDVMADNDVFNNPEYSRSSRRKEEMGMESNPKKQRNKRRSRTRDVGEMSRKIRNEKRIRSNKKKKENKTKRKKNTKSLNLAVKEHHHQRSKSLEINLEDLLKRGDDDDSVSEEMEVEEYVFTSSEEQWSEDSDTSDDSKEEEEDPTLSLWVGTWNVGESDYNESLMGRWLGSNSSAMHRMHDVYVIGLQECVSQHRKAWMNGILAYLDNGRKRYLVIQKMHLMNILLIVIVNKLYMFRIRDIKCKTVACGKGNIIGNKGAVAIAMTFDETTFAFVNVHLVARAERFVQRMENIERIFKNIDSANMGTFEKIDCLNQFHHVIFFGDLNYRIMKDFWEVCDLIREKRYKEFAVCDQLNHQMETNEILYGFREGDISMIPPTYRWERNCNVVSNKREQPPSYTDRILYKSLPECYSFWQTKYKSCMRCYGSDHRPMMSIFRFIPRNLPRHTKKRRKGKVLKNIDISFYEIRAYIDTTKSKANGLEISDTICCNLYYKYSSSNDHLDAVQKIDGGTYDAKQDCWCWSLNVLDSTSIMPYILDPEFLVTTHVHLQITNSSKYNSIIGYSVIPLFYVFPQSLVDREKIKTKYNPLFGDDFADIAIGSQITQNDRNDSVRKKRRKKLNDKEFNSPITIVGNYIGDIKGFIHAHSELVEKHRRITTKQKYK